MGGNLLRLAWVLSQEAGIAEREVEMLLLARVVRLATKAVAAVIVAGILLYVLGANASNSVVEVVMDAGRFLVGPFETMFTIDDAKWELGVNWGIAAVVWLVAGALVARVLVGIGGAGRRRFSWGRRRTA
jgi:hypothetical protein